MFYKATNFNGNVSTWFDNTISTVKLTNMRQIFRLAPNFNQDLNGWDVSNVATMFELFNGNV